MYPLPPAAALVRVLPETLAELEYESALPPSLSSQLEARRGVSHWVVLAEERPQAEKVQPCRPVSLPGTPANSPVDSLAPIVLGSSRATRLPLREHPAWRLARLAPMDGRHCAACVTLASCLQ